MTHKKISLGIMALSFLFGCNNPGNSNSDASTGDGMQCKPITQIISDDSITASITIPEGCWLVGEKLFVFESAVLTISAGSILKFAKETGISVDSNAALTAEGTETKPIVMTGQQESRGFWNGIDFTNSASPKNSLNYVTVEYAGAKAMLDSGAKPFSAAVMLDSSGYEVRVKITNSTLRNNKGYGFYFDSDAVVPAFNGNTITQNESGAGYIYAASTHHLSSDSTYTGNDKDLVFVIGDYEFGGQDRSWPAIDVPLHMDGAFLLSQHLTLAPGITLLFRKDAMIEISGDDAGITAKGTFDKPIIFSGTEKKKGHWGGLYFLNTNDANPTNPRTQLQHVTIEYGGSHVFNDSNAVPVRGNLMLDSSGWNTSVQLNNSVIRKTTGWGVWLDCLGVLTQTINTIYDNDAGDQGKEDNCG